MKSPMRSAQGAAMRKTSTYARKHASRAKKAIAAIKPAHSVEAQLARFEPFKTNTVYIASNFLLQVEMALDGLLARTIASDDVSTVDVIAQAIDVSKIRLLEISGDKTDAMRTLHIASNAILRTRDRWHRTGQWGLDGPAIQELRDAIVIYRDILMESSPMQMHMADEKRRKWIQMSKQGKVITVQRLAEV